MQKKAVLPIAEQKLPLTTEMDSIQDPHYKNHGISKPVSCVKILSIKTGEMKTLKEIESSFIEQNVSMTSSVVEIMHNYHFSMSREGYRLTQFACVSVGNLFPKRAEGEVTFDYEQILAAAIGHKISVNGELFFLTFPYLQDGMDIRVDYINQPKNEILHLMIEKGIPDEKGNLMIFSLGNTMEHRPILCATTVQSGKDGQEKRKFRLTDITLFRLRKEEPCF